MLRTKALRKIFIATLSLFILLFVVTIGTYDDINILRTNVEIEDVSSLKVNSIYLLNDNGLLVKSKFY